MKVRLGSVTMTYTMHLTLVQTSQGSVDHCERRACIVVVIGTTATDELARVQRCQARVRIDWRSAADEYRRELCVVGPTLAKNKLRMS